MKESALLSLVLGVTLGAWSAAPIAKGKGWDTPTTKGGRAEAAAPKKDKKAPAPDWRKKMEEPARAPKPTDRK